MPQTYPRHAPDDAPDDAPVNAPDIPLSIMFDILKVPAFQVVTKWSPSGRRLIQGGFVHFY